MKRPLQSYRAYMLTILSVIYAFSFTDRNVLGLLMQTIKTDLLLSDTQVGLLSGIAFALFYSTLGIPIAHWADRGNRVSIISLTVGLWSLMVIYCGMAATFIQLLLARIGVGVGEAGCIPPAQSLIADYYSRGERPRAMANYLLGGPLSVILGFAVAGWINERYGWRWAFFAIGIPGVLLSLMARLSLREPRLSSTSARSDSPNRIPKGEYREAFRTLWHLKTYRHLVVAFTLIYFFSFGIAQWAPSFLIRTHHIGTGELGLWYALIWGVGGAIGTYFGGYFAARYARDNERLQLTAMGIILSGFVPLYLGIYLSGSIYIAFSLMMISALLYCSIFGPSFAVIQEVVAPQTRALAVAIVLLVANLLGMGLGPLAVGMMSDLLRPSYGEESLRIALLVWTPGYLWAVYHLFRAAKYVQTDIAVSRSSWENIASESAG